jgi:signal transduction histidine kinase
MTFSGHIHRALSGMTIRSHLMLLAIGAVLPLVVFALLVSIVLVEHERNTFQRAAMDRARAIMSAVDAELRGSIATVQAITASPALQANDLPAFHAEALRVLATQPTWLDVTLARPSGYKVVDARRPLDDPGERSLDPASIARVAATARFVIGNVDQIDAASPPGIPIRVPVVVDGRVAYVLTAVVRPDSFENLIRQQRLPSGWISGIVDAAGAFVARIPERRAGEPSSPSFRAAVLDAPEGWYRGFTVEGKDTFTAHERSQFSNWSIGLAIPAGIVEAGAWRTAWMMGVGVASSILMALGIAALLGRRIARPIVALASVARSVGSGGAGRTLPADDVREVRDVAVALRDADVAVREREQLIEREKDALQDADRAKDEFIASLSHELRNPLAALTAAAHVLRVADPLQPAASDARAVIDRQTKHMSRMIEDLLDVSRLIAGKANLMPETFDLAALATSTVAAWRTAGRFTGQLATIEAHAAWVTADRTRTEQIVANLLDNAVKFTPPGRAIVVHVKRDADSSVLSVVDDGEGIDPALAARVFDVFVQGDQDVGRSKGGIGLGLTLVKRLAELQGGSVSVASDGMGRGATFTVRLPAAAAPPAVVSVVSGTHSAAPRREDQRRARAAGFDVHLVKPVTVERLDHAIASLHAPQAASASQIERDRPRGGASDYDMTGHAATFRSAP